MLKIRLAVTLSAVRSAAILAALLGCSSGALAQGIITTVAGGATEMISGRVTDAGTGTPLTNVTIWAVDANGTAAGQAVTDANGNYAIAPSLPGTFYLFTYNDQGYVDELFDSHACAGNCGIGGGTPVTVVAGVPRAGIDFALDAGASFAGTMTDALTHAAIQGASVYVLDAAGQVVSRSITQSGGSYRTTGLPAGDYFAVTANSLGYIEELYDNIPCFTGICNLVNPARSAIHLAGTATTGGIDFALETGGQIAGAVTRSDTSLGVPNVEVHVFNAAGIRVTTEVTRPDGTFATTGLPAGSYYVRTVNRQGLKDQQYAGVPCAAEQCSPFSGTAVTVDSGATTPGIDFLLDPGAAVTGVVTDAATGLPVSNVEIGIFDSTGIHLGSSRSDAAGAFTSTGLNAGTYYARTRGLTSYLEQLYSGLPCLGGFCSATSGTALVLTDPGLRAGVDFALSSGGSISGRVTAAGSGAPVAGVSVSIFTLASQPSGPPTLQFVQGADVDAAGNYTASGLAAGTYFAVTRAPEGYVDILYNGRPCPRFCYPGVGDPIAVTTGATTASIDFALPRAGQISGRVTDASGGAPLAGVDVQIATVVTTPAGPQTQFIAGVSTNGSGEYTIAGLLPGTYYVRTFNSLGYVNEAYDDVVCTSCDPGRGTPIAVSEGITTANINFALLMGGRINGRVTDASTGAGLPGVSVNIYALEAPPPGAPPAGPSFRFATNVFTDSTGAYSASGLPTGAYFAQTSNAAGYINEAYDDIVCVSCNVANGTPIPVTLGLTTPNINFALLQGAKVTGRVTDASTGTGLSGVSVGIYTLNTPPPGVPPTGPSFSYVTNVLTDGTGAYTAAGLPGGTYYAWTSAGAYINAAYDHLQCALNCGSTLSTPIVVSPATTTPNIDFALILGGRIAGTVTNAAGTIALPNVNVQVSTAGGVSVTSTGTDANGHYTIQGLPGGTYYARTFVSFSNFPGYLDQLYDHRPCAGGSCIVTQGTPIAVVVGQTFAGVDFNLEIAGQVSGRVTDATTGTGLAGVAVQVYSLSAAPPGPPSPTPTFSAFAITDASGNYTVGGLPTGTYYANTSSSAGYLNQIYNGIGCAGFCQLIAGTPIAVAVGATTPNIDFRLARGGSITGRVTGTGGAPLASVSLFAYRSVVVSPLTPPQIQFVTSAATDPTGRYTLQGLPDGTYFLVSSNAPGYVNEMYDNVPCLASCFPGPGSGAAPIAVAAGATAANIDFNLSPAGGISGRVFDAATGAPVVNVSVGLYTPAGTFVTSGFVTPTGTYSVPGLPVGIYFAAVNAPGYLPQLYNGVSCVNCPVTSGTPISVAAGTTSANIDFALTTPGRITGRVTVAATGLPASNVFIQAYAAPSGAFAASAQTDATGSYILQGLGTGGYFVRTFNSNGLVDQLYSNISCATPCNVTSGTPISVTVGATTGGVNFALSSAPRITGQLRDAVTNATLPAIVVSVYNESGTFAGSAFSDASGNYATGALTPGTYYARTSNASGYLDQLYSGRPCAPTCGVTTGTPIVVQAGQPTAGINFLLNRSARISGTVRSAATNLPLVSAIVELDDATGALVTRVFSDGSGNYVASGNLRTGVYYVRTVNTPRFVDEVFDDVTCLSCDPTAGTPVSATEGLLRGNVDFRLSPGGAISGRVTAAPGPVNIAGISVQVFDTSGTLVATATTDGSGNYTTTTGLPSGSYFARTSNTFQGLKDVLYNAIPCVYAGCQPTAGTAIAVTAGLTTPSINFALTPLGRITGVVRDALTSLPLSNVRVQIYTSTGALIGNGFQAGPGGYTIGGLAAGTYYAVASRPGYRQQIYANVPFTCIANCIVSGTPIAVGDGSDATGIDFALQPGGRIAGRIADGVSHGALASITAEIYDAAGVLVSRATSDGSGNYVSDAGLADGDYYVRTRNNRGYIDRLFPAVECGACALSSGLPVTVGGGLTTANINLDLFLGGRVSGTVTSNGRPIVASFQLGSFAPGFAGNYFEDEGAFVTSVPTDASGNYAGGTFVTVNVFDDAGRYVTRGTADGSGNYSTQAGLPNGFYYAVTANSAGLANQVYDGVPCPPGCDPLAGTALVITGGHSTNASFDLARGGRIAGVVRDAATGLPVRGAWVDIYDAANHLVATAATTSSGGYATHQGLPTGTYYARTRDIPGYRSERYNDLFCLPANCSPSGGTAISVTSPSTTKDIDFALTAGAPLQVPVITWTNPADITAGTALQLDVQLNATANVPGTLLYNPGPGTILAAGDAQVLSVAFTPSDTANYTGASASVLINVRPAATPIAIAVVSPNGGEKVFVGVPVTVRWTVAGAPSSIDVAVSTNGGATFLDIAGCTGLPGAATTCAWTPVATTAAARIRVIAHDPSGPDVPDASDADFRVAAGPPAVNVAAPNTAVTWAIGTTNTIKWTDNLGLDGTVSIELSRDGGTSWEVLAPSVPNTTASGGSWPWLVTGPATAAALVRVSSVDTPASDTSAVAFTIAAPAVTVTSPNTLITWKSGTSHNVTFTHNLGVGAVVDLELSRDGGATWSALATVTTTSAASGKYAWLVTTPQTTHALVRATWSGHAVSDVSDVEFTITPRINVTAPRTAVSWAAGSARQVTWTHNLDAGATVDIDASVDGGATWIRLASAVANATATTGTWTGAMPSTPTTQAVIRVSQTGVADEYDTSVVFTLAAPVLTVTAPASNVKWLVGSARTIRWTHNLGASESVSVELSRDGGATWTVLSPGVLNSGNAAGTFDWTVTGPATTTAVVRVTWTGGNGVSDVSAPFRIQ